MAKIITKKPPPLKITAEHIAKAAKSSVIQDLVATGAAFQRAGVLGPFTTELPMLASVMITGKSYRRTNVPAGSVFNVGSILIGRSAGLIFRFDCVGEGFKNSHGVAEWLECSWDDVINAFGSLADDVEARIKSSRADRPLVKDTDAAIKAAIKTNIAMHKVISDGFALAQEEAKKTAITDMTEDHPLWGSF